MSPMTAVPPPPPKRARTVDSVCHELESLHTELARVQEEERREADESRIQAAMRDPAMRAQMNVIYISSVG